MDESLKGGAAPNIQAIMSTAESFPQGLLINSICCPDKQKQSLRRNELNYLRKDCFSFRPCLMYLTTLTPSPLVKLMYRMVESKNISP